MEVVSAFDRIADIKQQRVWSFEFSQKGANPSQSTVLSSEASAGFKTTCHITSEVNLECPSLPRFADLSFVATAARGEPEDKCDDEGQME